MILYSDGGHNKTGTYGSWRIEDDSQNLAHLSERIEFNATTNNQAEYEALKRGIEDCIRFRIKEVRIYSDSLLMVSQINKKWKINNEDLRQRAEIIWGLLENFDIYTIGHVPRETIVRKLGH